MSWPTKFDGSKAAGYGFAGGTNSWSTIVATSGTANTKGSWVELCAATPFDARAILVTINYLETGINHLVDIGVGAAAAEVVLIPNLHAIAQTNGKWAMSRLILVPISIPAGTRIAARAQSTQTGDTDVGVSIALLGGGYMQSFAGVEDVGTLSSGDSAAVLVDPGGSANTKGSWTQLKAATERAGRALLVRAGNASAYGTFISAYHWRLDIAVGASSSEQIVVPDLAFSSPAVGGRTYSLSHYVTPPLPIAVPAGTRIAARLQCDGTDANLRKVHISGYLLY